MVRGSSDAEFAGITTGVQFDATSDVTLKENITALMNQSPNFQNSKVSLTGSRWSQCWCDCTRR